MNTLHLQMMHHRINRWFANLFGLTDRIISGLSSKQIEIASPVEKVSERSAIISFTLGSEKVNSVLYDKLLAQNIVVALRDGRIRVSPNFFYTEDEIDRFLVLVNKSY